MMKGMKASLLAGSMIALAALLWPASAQASGVGRLAYVSGEVWIEHGAAREAATQGRHLLRNDVIVTGLRGRAKLVMADGSRVYVGARSRIEVAEYVHRGGLLSGMFNMFWGKARFFVNKLVSRDSRFQVRTSTAVLGVRGTSFVVNQPMPPQLPPRVPDFDDFAKNYRLPTRVVLNTGRLQVRLPGGREVALAAGKTLDVKPDGAVSIRPSRAGDENSAPPVPGKKESAAGEGGNGAANGSAPSSSSNEGAARAPSSPPAPQGPADNGPGTPSAGGAVAGNAQGTASGSGATAGTAVTNAVQNLGVTTDVRINPQFVLP